MIAPELPYVKFCTLSYQTLIVHFKQYYIWYMSQVTYGITWICHVGYLRISVQQLVDVRELSAESSQVIRENIAGYSQNLCTVPAECSC